MTETALVTGAAGHTGTFMIRYLREKGYRVIATDLAKCARDELFLGGKWTADDAMMAELCSGDEFTYINADLTDKKSLEPLFEYDIDVVFKEDKCGRRSEFSRIGRRKIQCKTLYSLVNLWGLR
jgi:nucleoside-diphosphate-sugar epimerase